LKRLPIEKISTEVRLWLKGKTIEHVKVVRPTKEERAMYEYVLGPMALKLSFTDGTSVILDSWIGEFKPKKSSPMDKQHLRKRSYFTITRKEVIKHE
jgi:hypothetical protein